MKCKRLIYVAAAVTAALAVAGCQPATQRHTPPPAGTAQPKAKVSGENPGTFKRTSPPAFSP